MWELQVSEHAVLGRLVNDCVDESWLLFRRFPHLAAYCWASSSSSYRGHQRLPARMTDEAQAWETRPEGLARICTATGQAAALHSLGVFGVHFDFELDDQADACDRSITDAQMAAYQAFLEDEEAICKRVIEALLRYQGWLLSWDEYSFKTIWEIPVAEDAAGLEKTMEFSSVRIPRCSAGGVSPLVFHFYGEWDKEYGVSIVVYRGEFLGGGNHHLIGPLLEGPDEWEENPEGDTLLTEEEKRCRAGFLAGYQR